MERETIEAEYEAQEVERVRQEAEVEAQKAKEVEEEKERDRIQEIIRKGNERLKEREEEARQKEIERKWLEKVGQTEWINIREANIITQMEGENNTEIDLVNQLAEEFSKNGYTTSKEKEPIKVYMRKDGTLLWSNGHHRYYAAKKAGLNELPITYISKSEYDARGWSVPSEVKSFKWPPYQGPKL